MKKHIVLPPQRKAIQEAMRELHKSFPGKTDRQIAEFFVAETVKLPPYSTLTHALVTDVAVTTVGAFTLFHGEHPVKGKPAVVLIQRKERDAHGQNQYGAVGGYINPGFYELNRRGQPTAHHGEQPETGSKRESSEELLDDMGKSILRPEDLSPLSLVMIGIDERALARGNLATHYDAYAKKLTVDGMKRVLLHSQRMHSDTVYGQKVFDHSHGEVTNVVVMDLHKAAALKTDQFTHSHELTAIQRLNEMLIAQQSRNSYNAFFNKVSALKDSFHRTASILNKGRIMSLKSKTFIGYAFRERNLLGRNTFQFLGAKQECTLRGHYLVDTKQLPHPGIGYSLSQQYEIGRDLVAVYASSEKSSGFRAVDVSGQSATYDLANRNVNFFGPAPLLTPQAYRAKTETPLPH